MALLEEASALKYAYSGLFWLELSIIEGEMLEENMDCCRLGRFVLICGSCLTLLALG